MSCGCSLWCAHRAGESLTFRSVVVLSSFPKFHLSESSAEEDLVAPAASDCPRDSGVCLWRQNESRRSHGIVCKCIDFLWKSLLSGQIVIVNLNINLKTPNFYLKLHHATRDGKYSPGIAETAWSLHAELIQNLSLKSETMSKLLVFEKIRNIT